MKLSGKELERLHEALLEAFGKRDELERMLLFKLSRQLDHLAPEDDLESVVFVIINRAQRENWLGDLVKGAHTANPASPRLREFHDWYVSLPAASVAADPYAVLYMYDREPLLGRPELRRHVKTLNLPSAGARIFVVDGDPVSGKSYTLNYISYLKEHVGGFQFAWVDLQALTLKFGGALRPEDVGESIGRQLRLDLSTMPARGNEQAARWSQFFSDWFTGVIGESDEIYWIILDECRRYLRQDIRDLVQELAQRIAFQLDNARLVLLHQKKSDLPVNVLARVEEERIQNIGESELIEFFQSIHDRVRAGISDEEFENRIVSSVARVLRQVPPTGDRRLEYLSAAAREEAISILNKTPAP